MEASARARPCFDEHRVARPWHRPACKDCGCRGVVASGPSAGLRARGACGAPAWRSFPEGLRMGWTLSFAFGGLGLLLLVLSRRARSPWGLGAGETAALDDVTLFSKQHHLVGRPDRIV